MTTHIIFPMSGSNFFEKKEYFYPKPLIEINEKPLIQWVLVPYLELDGDYHFHFVVNRCDVDEFALDHTLRLLSPHCNIRCLAQSTDGAPCTALLLIDDIPESDDIVICNSDSIFTLDLNPLIDEIKQKNVQAAVLTFDAVHPRWSYVRTTPDGFVTEAIEKKPISRQAIAGFYYYKTFQYIA